MKRLSRRHLLAGLAATAGVVALPEILAQQRAHSATDPKERKFVIVFGGFGGASIIDSFMPIRHGESANADTINCFPDAQVVDVPGSPIRAVDLPTANLFGNFATNLSSFVAKHKQDMLVATLTGTSVNHVVAQKRAITGNGAWYGRTLQEAVALEYGSGSPLPNVNMSSLGYLEHGDDKTLPSYCYNEPVAAPLLWPIGLDGARGVKLDDGKGGVIDGPDPELVAIARKLRNEQLDPQSEFYTTFQLSERLQRWKSQRNETQAAVESNDLITKLNVITESMNVPLGAYDLQSSPDAALVQQYFPDLAVDPLHAQAALAFLLIKYGASVSVTIGPNFNIVLSNKPGEIVANPPLSFDYSHNDHRNTQAFMWRRLTDTIDGLITLLKATEFNSDTGESFWDRTLIYCATDFGRSKGRVGGSTVFGSGHNLNNGVLALSPMLKGNTVLGGVDADTGNTYGFDPQTGTPDVNREMQEGEIFGGLLQALGFSTSDAGLTDMPVMRKS